MSGLASSKLTRPLTRRLLSCPSSFLRSLRNPHHPLHLQPHRNPLRSLTTLPIPILVLPSTPFPLLPHAFPSAHLVSSPSLLPALPFFPLPSSHPLHLADFPLPLSHPSPSCQRSPLGSHRIRLVDLPVDEPLVGSALLRERGSSGGSLVWGC